MKSTLISSALGLAALLSVGPTTHSGTRRGVNRAFAMPYGVNFRPLGSNSELPQNVQDRLIHAAKVKRSRRAIKRQCDYDRCVTGNPLFSGPLSPFEKSASTANEVAQRPDISAKPMRYCGEKKKLQGKIALVRYFNKHGIIEAQFNDLELRWRNTNLAYGWHRFQLSEFEAI